MATHAQLYNFPGLSRLAASGWLISRSLNAFFLLSRNLCCSVASFFFFFNSDLLFNSCSLLCIHHLVQQQLNPSSVFPWFIDRGIVHILLRCCRRRDGLQNDYGGGGCLVCKIPLLARALGQARATIGYLVYKGVDYEIDILIFTL